MKPQVRSIFSAVVLSLPSWAQSPPDPKNTAQTAMATSLEKQRISITKQVDTLIGKPGVPAASFFTVPWIDFPSFVLPPCDPVPNDQLEQLIQQNSQRHGVQADLIRAVIEQESGGRPCAISSKGAQGLMQLMPSTVAQFSVRDPFDPAQNLEAGVKLLKQLLAKFNNDIKLTLAAYNAGSGRVESDGGVPPIPETTNYVDDIVSKLPKK